MHKPTIKGYTIIPHSTDVLLTAN